MNRTMHKCKAIWLFFSMFLLIGTLTGCTDNVKSEQTVYEDIKQCFKDTYRYINFDEITVVIDQRQTNKDDKVDYVWASISASNDDVQYSGSCTIAYVLYNDGWVLNDYLETDGQLTLLRSTLTEDEAQNAVWDECLAAYEDIAFVSRNTDLNYNEDIFYFQGKYTDGYLTVVDAIAVRYTYNYRNGWELEEVSCISSEETWDVLGKWVCNTGNSSMWLYIYELDTDTISIKFDFDYECEYESAWYGTQVKDEHYISNGIETRKLRETDNGTSFNLLNNDQSTPYVYLSKHQGITFDGVWFNDDDTFIFTYVGK